MSNYSANQQPSSLMQNVDKGQKTTKNVQIAKNVFYVFDNHGHNNVIMFCLILKLK